MATITSGGVNALFSQAFGRNATAAELKYWSGKSKDQLITALKGSGGLKQPFLETYGSVNHPPAYYKQQSPAPAPAPSSTGYGRYLTPAEAQSGQYSGKIVVIPGSGIRFKTPQDEPGGGAGSQAPTPPPQNPTDTLLNEIKTFIDEMKNKGLEVNPNITIDPTTTAEFTKIAEGAINPYYQTQLQLAREGLLSGIGYSQEQIAQTEQNLAAKYNQDFKSLGDAAAESGFASSGQRIQNESNLAGDYNTMFQQNRSAEQNRMGDIARAFAQQYGGQELKDTTSGVPTFNRANLSFDSGQVKQGAGPNQSLYNIDPNVYDKLVGQNEFTRRGQVASRVSELEGAFRQGKTIDQLRKLYL